MTGIGIFQAIGGFLIWTSKGYKGKYVDCWKKKNSVDFGIGFVLLGVLIIFIINAIN